MSGGRAAPNTVASLQNLIDFRRAQHGERNLIGRRSARRRLRRRSQVQVQRLMRRSFADILGFDHPRADRRVGGSRFAAAGIGKC